MYENVSYKLLNTNIKKTNKKKQIINKKCIHVKLIFPSLYEDRFI